MVTLRVIPADWIRLSPRSRLPWRLPQSGSNPKESPFDRRAIIEVLEAERDRLSSDIAALEGSSGRGFSTILAPAMVGDVGVGFQPQRANESARQ